MATSRVLTPVQEERVVSLLRSGGQTRRQIARDFGVSPSTIGHIAKSHGIEPGRRPWSDVEDDVIRSNYFEMGPRGLSRVLGRNYGSIYVRARQLGLSSRVGPYGKKRCLTD